MRINDIATSRLNEGLIDVPQSLIQSCEEELLKFISTTIIKEIGYAEELAGRAPSVYSQYNIEFKNYHEAYDLSGKQTLAVPIHYDGSDIKYHRLSSDPYGMKVLLFGATRSDSFSLKGKTVVQKNGRVVVVVNLSKLLKNVNRELDIDTFVSDDFPIESDIIQEMIDDDMETVGSLINHFMGEIRGTIKHELEHYIQIVLFKNKKKYDVEHNIDMDYEDYLTSDIEFHPTITSTLYAFKNLKDQFPNTNDDIILRLFSYVITQVNTLGFSPYDYQSSHEILPIMSSRDFFMALKKKDRGRWKTAVKYLYTELKNDGLI